MKTSEHPTPTHSDWYFTFGMGSPNRNKIIIINDTYNGARARMFTLYGDNWAFQYDSVTGPRLAEEYSYEVIRVE
jgi:hypothetical protein